MGRFAEAESPEGAFGAKPCSPPELLLRGRELGHGTPGRKGALEPQGGQRPVEPLGGSVVQTQEPATVSEVEALGRGCSRLQEASPASARWPRTAQGRGWARAQGPPRAVVRESPRRVRLRAPWVQEVCAWVQEVCAQVRSWRRRYPDVLRAGPLGATREGVCLAERLPVTLP